MPAIVGQGRPSKDSLLIAMRKALDIERRSRYADFHGRKSTFSQFMRRTAAGLSKQYPMDSTWITLRGLFRLYPNTDVATRISIIRRAEELLDPHLALILAQQNPTSVDPGNFEDAAAETDDCDGEDEDEAVSGVIAGSDDGKDLIDALDRQEDRSEVTTETSSERRMQKEDSLPTIKGLGVRIMPVVNGRPASSSDLKPAVKSSNQTPVNPGPSRNDSTRERPKDGNKDPEQVPVQYVKGVGPKMASVLSRLGINTAAELLRHYPRRHLDFQNRLMIRDLVEGQEVSIFGMIRTVSAFQSRNRNVSVLTVVISDGTGSITITRFVGGKSNKYLLDRYKEQYPKGAQVLASGIVERDQYKNTFALKNAEVEILGLVSDGEEEQTSSIHAGRLVPVYPLTEGLSLRYLRTVIHNALEAHAPQISDPLPSSIRDQLQLMDLTDSFYGIHFPDSVEQKDQARRRLVFDELFAIQLQLAHRRYKFDQNENALTLNYSETGLVSELIKVLPFKLTGAQERVFAEIAHDLSSNKPMHRLIQGDVGSGKTVVALLACLIAIENGYQTAIMAPTEILAEQHFRQFQRLITPLGLRCALVLGKQGVKERRHVRQEILTGQVHIAVGTHALLEDDVEFKNLGLIIIDEQHRFGVKQRARLKAKSLNPELLTMTATPIPRTLAMTMHGDLDVSEIDELPPGRKPVITKAMTPGKKTELWQFILKEIEKGRQAYIVFPLIEESESLSAKAATKEFEKLQQKFPQLRFGLMHGKLKPQEKDEVMEQFRSGAFQVLVSTTVIEVGVDVPNSSVMVIENADRFGLAQLHQLRGRVGRGAEQSYCFLVSDMKSPTVRERLEILTQTNDGFVVAEKDLELRGPGEFLGYRQSGLPDLILADLVKDAKILEEARNTAIAVVRADPELNQNPLLRKLLERRLATHEAEIMRSG